MSTATFIVELIRALAWPLAVVISVRIVAKAYQDQSNEGNE